MRRLHLTHHDPSVMQHGNFNITWPICDWLFGTWVSHAAGPETGERTPAA
jgi:sterol desaturase/sphingolipid hydroxylase (fatty acid hydroxylase superfamily)